VSVPQGIQRAGFSSTSAPVAEGNTDTQRTLDVRVLKSYKGRSQSGFTLEADFQVQPGFTVLVGPSGSGKSTLLRCIAGLADPDEGRIVAANRILFDDQKKISIAAAQRRVAFVFQRLALFPHLNVEENVGYGIRRLSPREREPQVANVLESFRIAYLRKQLPKEISGGEQQRVALARALVTDPSVLLLDEPLSSLDVHNKASIIEDLQTWNQKHSVPILYVTHSQEEMFALGEHVIVFDPGGVMTEGLPISSIPRRDNPEASDFDNLVEATVLGERPERGTMQCRISGTGIELEVPLKQVPSGSEIVVRIPAHAIVLATAAPELLGVCNVIQGQIQHVERMGRSFQVRIQCGVELRAELAPEALEGFRAPGRVWLIIPPAACHIERIQRLRPLQRLFVFVCGGNTSRSPLAQAICNAEVARRLRIPLDALGQLPVRAVSAGISVNPGSPMPEEAQAALQAMGLPRLSHKSQGLTPALVASAEAVFCMTVELRQRVEAMFPEAATKIRCLDPDGDIEDPGGAEKQVFRDVAARLRKLIAIRLTESGLTEEA
jgi:molybdate transport system ATP-binding protein